MYFIIMSVILFGCFKVSAHFNKKYDGMHDFSPVAEIVHSYYVASRALETTLITGSFVCTWFAIERFDASIVIASFVVGVYALAICTVCVVVVAKVILALLNMETLDVRGFLDDCIWKFKGIRGDFRNRTADSVFASVLMAGTLSLAGCMVYDMVTTIRGS